MHTVDAALDDSCSALLALECSRARLTAARGLDRAHTDIARLDTEQAIALVRHAIRALRSLAGMEQTSTIAFGFVNECELRSSR